MGEQNAFLHDDHRVRPLVSRTDLGVAVVILGFCAWLYYVTTQFEQTSPLFAQDVPPELFPRLLLWLIALLTLVVPFEQRIRGRPADALDSARSKGVGLIVYLTAALLIGVVAALPWLGVYAGTVLVCVALPLLWGERRWPVVLAFAALFPAAVALLFSYGLKVHFDPGVLGLGFP